MSEVPLHDISGEVTVPRGPEFGVEGLELGVWISDFRVWSKFGWM